jgi:hypothetical protein
MVNINMKGARGVEISYQSIDVISYPWPSGFVERCTESIWAWRGIAAHVLNDGVELLLVRYRVDMLIIV